MADEQSITFPEMSSKLERCCLAVAKARREQEEAEASHRAHQQQRLELERRMEEDRCGKYFIAVFVCLVWNKILCEGAATRGSWRWSA